MPRTRLSTTPSTPLSPPTTPSPPQSPTSQPRNLRPSLSIPDLEAGCIVWLPSKNVLSDSSSDGGDKVGRRIRCIRASCCGNAALNEKGYNHPIVVLKTSMYYLGDKNCLVAMITSQYRNGQLDRLPISQEALLAPPYPPAGNSTITELYLEETAKMNKQSYILLTHIFQLRASYLRSLSFRRTGSHATDTRLREESHARLMSELHLQRGVWIHTAAAVCAPSSSPSPSPRSRAAEGTRRAARRGRAARGGRRYPDAHAAVTRSQSLRQPQTPQSARVERAVRQVSSRSAAAVETGVSSPVYIPPWMQHRPVLGRETALRMPGAWEDAERQVGGGGGLPGYGYGSAGVRSERWGSEPPRDEGRAVFYFKVVVVLLAVVAVLWWM